MKNTDKLFALAYEIEKKIYNPGAGEEPLIVPESDPLSINEQWVDKIASNLYKMRAPMLELQKTAAKMQSVVSPNSSDYDLLVALNGLLSKYVVIGAKALSRSK